MSKTEIPAGDLVTYLQDTFVFRPVQKNKVIISDCCLNLPIEKLIHFFCSSNQAVSYSSRSSKPVRNEIRSWQMHLLGAKIHGESLQAIHENGK